MHASFDLEGGANDLDRDAGSKYAETRLRTSRHWKGDLKSFPTVYDMPIWSHIGVSYTVGKLLSSILP